MSTQGGQTWSKLASIAGMLGSPFENERSTAARLATAEIKRLGLTWYALVERAFAPARAEPPPRPKQPEYGQPGFTQGDFFRASQQAQQYQEARKRAQRAYADPFGYSRQSATQRWSKRHGLDLYKFAVYACAMSSRLNQWEHDFVRTFVGFGPGAVGTVAQWRHVVIIANKLGVPVQDAA